MTFRGTTFREGDHFCLSGTAEGHQIGGQRVEQFMQGILGPLADSGQEFTLIVVPVGQTVRIDPEVRADVDDAGDLASAM